MKYRVILKKRDKVLGLKTWRRFFIYWNRPAKRFTINNYWIISILQLTVTFQPPIWPVTGKLSRSCFLWTSKFPYPLIFTARAESEFHEEHPTFSARKGNRLAFVQFILSIYIPWRVVHRRLRTTIAPLTTWTTFFHARITIHARLRSFARVVNFLYACYARDPPRYASLWVRLVRCTGSVS